MLSFDKFNSPASEMRGKSFWAWNGDLKDDELQRQIQIFRQMGMGGFFMHARTGLRTPYLSEEWFDKVELCIKEARNLQMEAWFYDEDNYPSGFAGGIVTANKKYRQRVISYEILEDVRLIDNNKDEVIDSYFFIVYFSGREIESYSRIISQIDINKLPANAKLVRFDFRLMETSQYYNGFTYLNSLDPDAVKEFIRVAYAPYVDRFKEIIGKSAPGIFTDEPNFRSNPNRGPFTTWTEKLPEVFKELYGYDIIEKLPELFFDRRSNDFNLARYHFNIVRTRMFVEAYAGQIGSWCQDNGLELTGHVVGEWPISQQVCCAGSAMQFYPHMQRPGIDVLLQDKLEYLSVKQVVSVARQTGKKWMMSEMYGATGWDIDFETYKFIGDWQAVLGINMRCLHLSWYTMLAEGKRDYPASINHFSPWWKEYHYIEDYFARINALLSEGDLVCDLGVIHPIESYYSMIKVCDCPYEVDPAVMEMDEVYDDMISMILGNQIDFDFIDEHLLKEFEGAVILDESNVPVLKVGFAKYKTILVPPLNTIRAHTLKLLSDFADKGGTVIFVDDFPLTIEGKAYARNELNSRFITVLNNSIDVVRSLSAIKRIFVEDRYGNSIEDIFVQFRKKDDDYILFMVNKNRKQSYKYFKVKVKIDNPVLQLLQCQACENEIFDIEFEQEDDCLSFETQIESSGSRLFVLSDTKRDFPKFRMKASDINSFSLDLTEYEYRLDDFNLIVLDRADCLISDNNLFTDFCNNMDILEIDAKLRRLLDLPERGFAMVQPWVDKVQDTPIREIVLRYNFNIETLMDSPVFIAAEQAENWCFIVNGKIIDNNIDGSWIDTPIKKVKIDPSFFKPGVNTIELRGWFGHSINLENIYLLGNFGVKIIDGQCFVGSLPDKLMLGDLTKQGLPFYGGNVFLEAEFDIKKNNIFNYSLFFPSLSVFGMIIKVNDAVEKLLGFPCYESDISGDLRNGRNRLLVKLLGSRHNSFGPLHHVTTDRKYCSPPTFRPSPENYEAGYNISSYGLFESPDIIVNKTNVQADGFK